MYRDAAELTDAPSIYMYYIQAKSYILSGKAGALSDNQVVDFGSLQLQANYGDLDAEKSKSWTFGVLDGLLPPPARKMTMSKTEAWWQKKLLAAYQDHRGLTKIEAQKAYIALAQSQPLYPYQIFEPAVRNIAMQFIDSVFRPRIPLYLVLAGIMWP